MDYSSGLVQRPIVGTRQFVCADPVEAYSLLYFPKVAKGMALKFGRYISPPDIEAQLAPDNYLFTHSLMFDYDAHTNTWIQANIMANKQ